MVSRVDDRRGIPGRGVRDCGEIVSVNWFEEKATGKFLGAGRSSARPRRRRRRWRRAGGRAQERDADAVLGEAWEHGGGERRRRLRAGGKAINRGRNRRMLHALHGEFEFSDDDDAIWQFFMDNAGVEPTTVRWLTNTHRGVSRGRVRGFRRGRHRQGGGDEREAVHGRPIRRIGKRRVIGVRTCC